MKRKIIYSLLAVLLALSPVDASDAKPFVCPLFSDNMVLQRDRNDPVWGWTKPGENVTVSINGQSVSGTADAAGKWMVSIQPPPTGGPYQMDITGPQEAHFKNVMVGDVWICSGQSNMTLGVKLINNGKAEIAAADHPSLRFYDKNGDLKMEPTDQTSSNWRVCTPAVISDSGMGFTATGYFFGRDLQADLKIPVGLIHTSWGGTPIEGWTSVTALQKATHDFDKTIEEMDGIRQQMRAGTYDYNKLKEEWYSAAGVPLEMAAPEFDDSGWKALNLPASQDANSPAKMPEGTGVVFFRKTFDLPSGDVGKSSRVHFGYVKFSDQVLVNGVDVGSSSSNGERTYWIRPGLLKAGKNVIAMRTYDRAGGNAGIYGDPDKLTLTFDGNEAPTIPLAGEWKYFVGPPLASAPPFPPAIVDNSQLPSELFNGMINPLTPFAIKGVVWYQGESNAGRAWQYRTLLPTMINDWRSRWQLGNFPFLIVQLANFHERQKNPGDSDWAELREAQWITAKALPNAALVTPIDIGNPDDIHPKNKQEIGRRLALTARALVYGERIEYSGPIYESMQVLGSEIRIKFTHADGLTSHEIPPLNPIEVTTPPSACVLNGFAISGEDQKFVWADAKIDGSEVVVSSAQVPNPVAVRYDWGDNPPGTLYNAANLPALPFRTDDWPLKTLNNK